MPFCLETQATLPPLQSLSNVTRDPDPSFQGRPAHFLVVGIILGKEKHTRFIFAFGGQMYSEK